MTVSLLLLLILQVLGTKAHVTLTFPEARFPPLDFLDTARTIGPCGVPKSSRSFVSNFKLGKSYNISWRMQYPHQGGYRLQLLKEDGSVMKQLVPKLLDISSPNEFAGLDDQTAESQIVEFDSVCTNCTLLLERQALEWGKTYRFRSCAEVNVLEQPNDECSGKSIGTEQGSKCNCEKNFSGQHCQYEDDCTTDSDCRNGGKCIQDSIQSSRKSCFCAYGYFGMSCEKKSFSMADSTSESFSCFAYNELQNKENSFSYGMFNASCYKKVELNSGDFLYSRVVKNQVEIILDFETESYVAMGWRPLQIPTTCRLFPDLASSLASPDGKAHYGDRKATATAGYLQSALNSPLHPMDCTDVVMASIFKPNYLHIEDMYTRDRSSPLSDSWLDGEQSLSSAYGLQVDGRSLIMFRRLIREIEPTDHPLGPGKIFVIHAKGQSPGSYHHTAPSAIEEQHKLANVTVKNEDFYRNDQWKYHGSENRGIKKLELVSAEEMTKFRSPLVHILSDGAVSLLPTKVEEAPSTVSPLPKPETKPSSTTSHLPQSQATAHPDTEPEPTAEAEPQSEPKSESVPSPDSQSEHDSQPDNESKSVEKDGTLSSCTTTFINFKALYLLATLHLICWLT